MKGLIIMKKIIKLIYSFFFVSKEVFINKNKISFNSFFWKTKLSLDVKIQEKCKIVNSQIDNHTYIGNNSYITNCKIGKFCSIASGFNCAFGKHPTKRYVSTHPYFYSRTWNNNINGSLFKEYKYIDENNKIMAFIGNDVWIGTNVTILDGISIGNGAIIGACSLINKDVPPYAIVAGVPGKIIGFRFDKDEIDFLEEIKWWNRDIKWIDKNVQLFDDIKKFMDGVDK